MAQTAVDYIFKKLDVLFTLTPQTTVTGTSEEWENLYKQAKAKEKEQIVNADLNATIRTAKGFNADVYVTRVKELAETYYNEEYNK